MGIIKKITATAGLLRAKRLTNKANSLLSKGEHNDARTLYLQLEEMGFVVAYQLGLLGETFDIDISDTAALLSFYYTSSGLGAPETRTESFGGGEWIISDYSYEDGEYSLQGWIAVGRGGENTLLVVVGSSPETYAENQALYDAMFDSGLTGTCIQFISRFRR